MKQRFYKELWNLRFRKMLELEKKSILDYEVLLGECRKRFKDHAIIPNIEKIIEDEKMHVILVNELLGILAKKKVADGKK